MTNHIIGIGLNVSDLERSVDFYTRFLGMQEAGRLDFGDGTEVPMRSGRGDDAALLMLVASAERPVSASPADWGRVVVGIDDVASAVDDLRVAGHTVEDPVVLAELGVTVAFVTDPDGYPLELVQFGAG